MTRLPALARLAPVARRVLPAPLYLRLRAMRDRIQSRWILPHSGSIYEALYERHACLHSEEDVVGAGDYEVIGRLELSVLVMEHLKPTDTVVDFGCGTGRLAVYLIPHLVGGHYIGVEVSRTILQAGMRRIQERISSPPCRVTWLHQTSPRFALGDETVDILCAFSVFTHMEHEDTYRYLREARRIVRPGGRVVLSCLPLDLQVARDIFLASASLDFEQRWSVVRNVTTSHELMEAVARLAGWMPRRWYRGDGPSITVVETGERSHFGQSICVLEPGASG